MLWFCNSVSGAPRFIGIHCDQRPESYALLVLYPDGSEDTECFEDATSLLDAAKKLGSGLDRIGWEACPATITAGRRES